MTLFFSFLFPKGIIFIFDNGGGLVAKSLDPMDCSLPGSSVHGFNTACYNIFSSDVSITTSTLLFTQYISILFIFM